MFSGTGRTARSKVVDRSHHFQVFVNGNWIGVTEHPGRLVDLLRNFRRSVPSNRTIGIYFDSTQREIKVTMDAGRTARPLLVVENNALVLQPEDLQHSWNDLEELGAIEMIDVTTSARPSC